MEKRFLVGKKNTTLNLLCGYLGNLFFLLCLVSGLAMILFSLTTIECEVTGPSMQPTLNRLSGDKHDMVYINKYDKDYGYEDIIVIKTESESIIKRVIGLPGDTIDIVNDGGIYKLERNGEIVEEDYIYMDLSALTPTSSQNGMNLVASRWLALKENYPHTFNESGKLIVGEGEVFALGDHRSVSQDSSVFGNFPNSSVEGVVESVRYYGDSQFEFYFNYIVEGRFIYTIINMF